MTVKMRQYTGKLIPILMILVIALSVSNLYFINESKELDYKILIGIPQNNKADTSLAVDFTKSEYLKEPTEQETILFSLINADSIDTASIPKRIPDAVMYIGNKDSNESIPFLFWLEEASVIYTVDSDTPNYKKVNDSSYAPDLEKLIEKYINRYKP